MPKADASENGVRLLIPNEGSRRKRGVITEEELGKGLFRLNAIWFAMLASVAVYLFVGHQIAATLQTSMDEHTFAMVKWVLYTIAFVTLIITRYIKKVILSGKGRQMQTTQVFQHPALQKYATAMIVAWALSESIGIYGLLLFMLGKNTTDLYLLILVSAIAMFTHRPRSDEIITLSQKSLEVSNIGGVSS